MGSIYFRYSSLLSQLHPTVSSIILLQLSLLCTFLLGCTQFICSVLILSFIVYSLSFYLFLYFLFFCTYVMSHFHYILSFSVCIAPHFHHVLSCNGLSKIY